MLLGNQVMELASEIGREENTAFIVPGEKFEALRDDSPAWQVVAQKMYSERTARNRFFPGMLFGEAAWDMLLDLYIAEKRNRLISITSACIASNVPPTTALRWITILEREGLVVRRADQRDGRRNFVQISERGYALMTAYFVEIQPQWRLDDVLRPQIQGASGILSDPFDKIPRNKSKEAEI